MDEPTPKLPGPSGAPATGNPYVDWAWGPGWPYYFAPGIQDGPEKRMTLLVQIRGISAERFVHGGFFIKNERLRKEWRESFVVPFPGLPVTEAAENQLDWVIGFVTPMVSATLTTSQELKPFVVDVLLGRPLPTEALPTPTEMSKEDEGLTAKVAKLAKATMPAMRPVFMGVIDDGIAFANERFRVLSSTGQHRTRVQDWWLMGAGITLAQPAIDNLFTTCTSPNGVLQEDLVYRAAGLLDYTQGGHKAAAWRVTHGTHVMDAACGYDPSANRLDRPIACVQLPNAITAAVDNGDLYPYFVLGVSFILTSMLNYCATRGIPPIPVVINFSYGRIAGAHDGTGSIESFIDWICGICDTLGFPLRIVLPSGNSFESRTHAQMQFTAAGQSKSFDWHVLPDDQTESFVEIWTPPQLPTGGSRLTLTITDPAGNSFSINESMTVAGIGTYGLLAHVWKPTRGEFVLILPPTASLVTGPLAYAGAYRIRLTHTGGLAPTDYIDAWVARDDSIPGYPQRGRQSYLDDSLYEYRNPYTGRSPQVDNASLVQRQATINSIATSRRPIVVGGYVRKDLEAASYTAAGARLPRPQPPRLPDALAPSDDTGVLTGRLAAGSHSGGRVSVSGTSVAAPQIARWVADDLAKGFNGDRASVQAQATFDEANAPPDPPPIAPPPWPFRPPPERGLGRVWSTPLQKVKRYEW